jgi:hypothetical protein
MTKRLVPLSGAVAVGFILASFIAAGTVPKQDAPTSEVVSFYTDHESGQLVSASVLSLGALLFLVFMAVLRGELRRGEGTRDASRSLCFAGGILLVVGLTIFAGLTIALGDVANDIDPSALQALHVLNQEMFFPVTIGTAAFLLGAGAAVLQGGPLPKWLGWPTIAVAIVAGVPSHVLGGVLDHIGFAGFIGLAVWTLIVSVLLALRPSPANPLPG